MIIDRALLIPGRQTPMLFQPIAQPLDALAEAVEGPMKGTGAVCMLLPWEGDTATGAAQGLPHLATTVSFVPSQTTRPPCGASAPAPLHSPACPQRFTGDGFVPLPRGEGQRHPLAPAFRTDVDLRTEAAWTATERFSLRALCLGPSRVVVRADDGAIHVVAIPVQRRCGVGRSLDRSTEASPEARLAPAGEAAGASGPAAIPLREVTPRGTGTEDPQEAVQDASVVSGGAASGRFLRRKQGL
jgi:hypothetical protein